MFESTPQPSSQDKNLEAFMPQMKIELEGKWRAAKEARQNANPYDLIDTVIDNQDFSITERIKAKNTLIAHLRQYTQ